MGFLRCSMLFLMLVVLTNVLTGVNGQFPPVCNTTNSQSPALPVPSLPMQYSTTIQAIVGPGELGKYVEYGVRDYFDDIGNRGRLEIAHLGNFSYSVYDYNLREIFTVDADEGCTVRKIADTGDRVLFGVREVNGSVHIGRVSDFFLLGNTSNLVYKGEISVRGIPCNRWQSCTVRNDSTSYTVDYYFSRSSPDWMSAYDNDPVPVQIVVNGTAPNSDDPNTFHNVQNTYLFASFNSGQDSVPDDVFQIPTGISCKGRIDGKPLPLLPDYFSTFVELVDEDEQTVNIIKEYYDLKLQLFRADYYSDGDSESGLPEAPYTLIHDFNLETQYIINRQLRNCSISAIKPERGFDRVVEDGMARLASPRDLLLLTNEFNYSYEGISNVRGVDVESWISYREFEELGNINLTQPWISYREFEERGNINLTNTLYEIFFTRSDWSIGTSSSPASSQPSIWRIKLSGIFDFINSTTSLTQSENFSSTFDFFGFSSGEPDKDEFDTSVCVSVSDYYIVILFIPIEGVQVDYSQLPRNVRSSLADFTKVQPLQIGNIQVNGADATDLYLSLHISNLTDVSLPLVKYPVTAYEAVNKLTSSVDDDNKLSFTIELEPGKKVTPTLITIRNENGTVYHIGDASTDDSCDSGLSDGVIAGIAIWMLILGLGIGIIGTMCVIAGTSRMRGKSFFFWKKGGGGGGIVSYKKHEDE